MAESIRALDAALDEDRELMNLRTAYDHFWYSEPAKVSERFGIFRGMIERPIFEFDSQPTTDETCSQD